MNDANHRTPSKRAAVMQTRCVFCKQEQYGPAVYDVSMNNGACPWCGKVAGRLSEDEYARRLKDE